MVLRQLQPDEWPRLEEVFVRAFSEHAPSPQRAVVVVAEEGGEICGFLAAQMLLHAEPLWVSPEAKNRFLIPQLIRCMRETFPEANYCFVNVKKSRLGRFLQKLGFVKLPWEMWRWTREESHE